MQNETQGLLGRITDQIEETLIAIFLGLMTIITFANVIARYVLNTNILWALEMTVYLFAWMVLLGVSYGVKKNFHLGVDVILNILPASMRKLFALIAVAVCLTFSLLLLKGSWEYWYPFVTKRAFLETDDIPMPEFMQFLAVWLNEGEKYEKIPRFIPYAALPIASFLLTFRFLQAGWRILFSRTDRVIAGHEVEEELAEARRAD